jgi:alkylation response protein AidB-like acyl-CoA dehydrogenase
MDFSIPAELQATLDKVRRFMDDEVIPLEKDFLLGGMEPVQTQLDALRRKVKTLGLWLPQIPKDHGGMGLNLMDFGLIGAELGRSPLGHYVFNCQAPDAGNMEILMQYANPAQQARFMVPLLNGEIRSCFGMTEPEFPGSNPSWMGTRAVRDGNEYVINGHKWFATGADGAAFCVVMAVTNSDGPPHKRASMFLVPMDTPGAVVEANTPVMGHTGSGWASHGELRFTDCRVPAENMLGPMGDGFLLAQERLGPGRIHHCMRWIGVSERSFEILRDYLLRRQVAPGEPLAMRQFAQGWIAESRAEIDAARLMVLHAAWAIEKHGLKAAREEVSLIKFHTANMMMHVVDRAIQAHGGLGVTDYTPLSFFFRFERAGRIYDGPDEVHRLVVAKRILKRRAAELIQRGEL